MTNDSVNEFALEMTKWLKEAKAFTLEQGPEIFKQVIQWAIAEAIIVGVISVIVLISDIVVAAWIYKTPKNYSSESWIAIGCVYIGVTGLLSSIGFSISLHSIVQATMAPKIYLIEYFAHSGRSK